MRNCCGRKLIAHKHDRPPLGNARKADNSQSIRSPNRGVPAFLSALRAFVVYQYVQSQIVPKSCAFPQPHEYWIAQCVRVRCDRARNHPPPHDLRRLLTRQPNPNNRKSSSATFVSERRPKTSAQKALQKHEHDVTERTEDRVNSSPLCARNCGYGRCCARVSARLSPVEAKPRTSRR